MCNSDAVSLPPGCALCRLSDDDPAMFGEKVTLKEHKFSVHYLCLVRPFHRLDILTLRTTNI